MTQIKLTPEQKRHLKKVFIREGDIITSIRTTRNNETTTHNIELYWPQAYMTYTRCLIIDNKTQTVKRFAMRAG